MFRRMQHAIADTCPRIPNHPALPPPPSPFLPCCTDSRSVSLCLSAENVFLQRFFLQGTARRARVLTFTNSSGNPNPLQGLALLSNPVTLFEQNTCNTATLNTSFSLSMDPSAASTGGVTFAILQSSSGPSSYTSGGLGYLGSGQGLSIEFDVWKDAWDPDGNHIGLNIGGSVESVTTASLNFSLLGPAPTYVWITYEPGEKALRVFASKQRSKPAAPLLQYFVSLCVLLRPQPLQQDSVRFFAGFTAEGPMLLTISDWCFSASEPLEKIRSARHSGEKIEPKGTQ